MRRDHRRKLKFLDANYPIGTTQCLARATTDLHPKGAFLALMAIDSISLVSQRHALSKIQKEMNTDKIKQPDIADSLSMQTSANRDAPPPPGRSA